MNASLHNSPPPGSSESRSLWVATSGATDYPALTGDVAVDVAIVGGGITGLTAAYLAVEAGASVAVIDKGRIAMGESGQTTAHLVEATDADYRELVRTHGEEGARLNTEAIRAALDLVRSLVDRLAIDCDFRVVDGYLYAEDEQGRHHLERQQEYLERSGLRTEWCPVPLPFATQGGLRFRDQARFQARDYLLAIGEAAAQRGARLFESSLVTAIDPAAADHRIRVRTARGTLTAGNVVLATHVPLNDRGVLWAKMHATRSYVVGAPLLEASLPDALFWDTADPYHYTRIARHGNDRFLVVGGEDRDVGDDDNDEQRYAALESFCRDRFGVADFPYRWSGQINEPADGLPFIGRSSQGERVWMATGYSGTGMTYGTLAAMLLTDLATGRENRFAKLYDPGRTSPKAVVGHVLTKAVELPKRMVERVTGRDIEADSLDQVREGEGKIVKADGHRWAAARLADGLHVVDATCTHMGCTVEWNAAERSWDCPCHGSRFTVDGDVLNGPATEALAPRGG